MVALSMLIVELAEVRVKFCVASSSPSDSSVIWVTFTDEAITVSLSSKVRRPLSISRLKAVRTGAMLSSWNKMTCRPTIRGTIQLSFMSLTVAAVRFKYVLALDVARLVSLLISLRSFTPRTIVISLSFVTATMLPFTPSVSVRYCVVRSGD